MVLCRIPKKGFIIMKKIISFILALSLLAVCAVSFASCGKEEIVMELNSPLTGMAIRSPETDSFYYMVVPMRLN